MKLYQLTEKETALLLQALCVARRHDMDECDGINEKSYRRLFNTIVQQHDLQQEVDA